jgi:hypothetical protein
MGAMTTVDSPRVAELEKRKTELADNRRKAELARQAQERGFEDERLAMEEQAPTRSRSEQRRRDEARDDLRKREVAARRAFEDERTRSDELRTGVDRELETERAKKQRVGTPEASRLMELQTMSPMDRMRAMSERPELFGARVEDKPGLVSLLSAAAPWDAEAEAGTTERQGNEYWSARQRSPYFRYAHKAKQLAASVADRGETVAAMAATNAVEQGKAEDLTTGVFAQTIQNLPGVSNARGLIRNVAAANAGERQARAMPAQVVIVDDQTRVPRPARNGGIEPNPGDRP